MKKTLALLLALCMVFALAACGNPSSGGSEGTNPPAATNAPAPTEAPAPAGGDEPAPTGGDEPAPAPADTAAPFTVSACIASEPETIDPTMISSVDGNTYVNHLFENLLRYASTGKAAGDDPKMMSADLELGQAKSYEVSEDGLTYTFHLRDDIFWSDGVPVVAQDWVYAWQRVCDPDMAADYGYLLADVGVVGAEDVYYNGADPDELGIKALDEKTLQISLLAATPFFDQICAFGNLMPLRKDVIDAYGDEWTDPAHLVCNGPYVVNEWVHDSYISMVPNEKYYDLDSVGPQEIRWYLSDDENAILASYESGEYDFIETFPADRIDSLVASGDCYILPAVTTYYLYINCDNIQDWRVRAAIALCIDRENIVANVTQSGEIPAASLVTGGITDSTGAMWQNGTGYKDIMWAGLAEQYPDYDLTSYFGRCELAQDLLAAAVADGFDVSVTIPYRFNNLGRHGSIAEAVQQDVNSVLGLNMTMDSTEWQVYTSTLSSDRDWSVARLGWQADYLDGSSFLDLFKTGGAYNYSNWSNPDYDALCARYKAMPGGAERDAVMYDAEALLFTEGGFGVCPLYYYTNFYCLSSRIHNAASSTLGFYLFTEATPD